MDNLSADLDVESPSAVPLKMRSRGLLMAAIVLQVAFTATDLFAPGLVSVLYFVPLILLAWAGYGKRLRWVAAGLVLLNYAAYCGKYFVRKYWLAYQVAPLAAWLGVGLVNRTFVAVVLCLLEVLLEFRVATEFLRRDVELPEPFRREEDETDETAAMLVGVAATVAIFAADIPTPANYDLAVLYLVPLFLCAWSRSRRFLWSLTVSAIALSAIGYKFGPPPTNPPIINFPVNRVLTGVVTVLVALLLHFRGSLHRGRSQRTPQPLRRAGGPAASTVD